MYMCIKTHMYNTFRALALCTMTTQRVMRLIKNVQINIRQ